MNKTIVSLFVLCLYLKVSAQTTFTPKYWGDWQTWGEKTSTKTYVNPVLPGDFSDIDCIEHDGYFYAISSTFQYEPGMVILRSTDMVNWRIYSHAVPNVSEIGSALNYTVMDRYGNGIWAGAIRYHEGLFYVYFGTPNEGMFMTTSEQIEGPWQPLTKMNFDSGWDDCCPFFDEDGKNYFVATHFAGGYKTYIFPLSQDGKTVDWEKKVLINEGYGREASKLYKWNGKYYHMFSEDKDGGRYLVMQRSANPMGPYNEQHRLHYTEREWNEPNQGGYLKDAEGNWFFLTHHGSGNWGGRETSLLPVTWTTDGWPIIGNPDGNNVGQMVWNHKMPVPYRDQVVERLKGEGNTLRINSFLAEDWEWNYHPYDKYFERTDSALVLKAFKPLQEDNLLKAGNTLTMRSWQTPYNEAVVKMDLSAMKDGQYSGMCHFSQAWVEFGVSMEKTTRSLYYRTNDGTNKIVLANVPEVIYLRSTWGLDGQSHFAYSLNGSYWVETGLVCNLAWSFYRGDRLGLYTYNNKRIAGQTTFSEFSYICSDKTFFNLQGKKYYLTNERHAQHSKYLCESTTGRLSYKEPDADLLQDDSYAWYLEFDDNLALYALRNAKSGKYLSFNGSAFAMKSKDAISLSESLQLKPYPSLLNYKVGKETFSTHPYWIARGTRTNSTETLTGSATSVSASVLSLEAGSSQQRWLILSEDEIGAMNLAHQVVDQDRLTRWLNGGKSLLSSPHDMLNENADSLLAAQLETLELHGSVATPEERTALAEELQNNILSFLSLVKTDAQNPLDLTFMIDDAVLDDGCNWVGIMGLHDGCIELTSETFDISTELPTKMPKGTYALMADAFQRPGTLTRASLDYAKDVNNVSTYLYANTRKVLVHHACEGAGAEKLDEGGSESAYKEMYQPTDWQASQAYFAHDRYANLLAFQLSTSVKLTIGMKNDSEIANNWFVAGGFKLYYYGTEVEKEDVQTGVQQADMFVDAAEYDLQGRPVHASHRGITIHRQGNGKASKILK